MAETFLIELVTPAEALLSEEVDELTAPGAEGEFGVLAGHTPFLTVLKPGELSYKKGGRSESIAISRGYAEVLPDKTTILVESATRAADIDLQAARETLSKSEEAIKGLTPEDAEYQATLDAIDLAEAQIRIREKK